MDKNFVNSFLISNGKYFPSNKLSRIGLLMENSGASEYSVNKRFYSPLVITIIFWVFWPFQLFDRFVLRDWFGGILKIMLPFLCGYVIYLNANSIESGVEWNLNLKVTGIILVLWILWTILDGFTIYHRTKSANYRSLLKALNINDDNYIHKPVNIPKDALKNENSEILEWRKSNPHASINDFYKRKKS